MKLSKQEKKVFNLIEKGYKIGYIAELMDISVQTASTYKNRIKIKLSIDETKNDHYIVKKYNNYITVEYNQDWDISYILKGQYHICELNHTTDKFEAFEDMTEKEIEYYCELMVADKEEYDRL